MAVNVGFLLTILKDDAGNSVLRVEDTHHIQLMYCSLRVKILLFKLKTVHTECFLHIIFMAVFIDLHFIL